MAPRKRKKYGLASWLGLSTEPSLTTDSLEEKPYDEKEFFRNKLVEVAEWVKDKYFQHKELSEFHAKELILEAERAYNAGAFSSIDEAIHFAREIVEQSYGAGEALRSVISEARYG